MKKKEEIRGVGRFWKNFEVFKIYREERKRREKWAQGFWCVP